MGKAQVNRDFTLNVTSPSLSYSNGKRQHSAPIPASVQKEKKKEKKSKAAYFFKAVYSIYK